MTTTGTLNDVIATLENGRKGFAEGADKLAKDGRTDIAGTFRQYSEQRGRFAAEIREMAGVAADEAPKRSMAGALHRGWMSLKDAIAGDDPNGVLDVAEQGEDHAKSVYEAALADNDLSPQIRQTLTRQYTELTQAHDRVRSLRTASR
jgi:uncharacterized protein (TIGR02284 family)